MNAKLLAACGAMVCVLGAGSLPAWGDEQHGGAEIINAWLHGGAGGPNGIHGDYLWLNQRPSYLDAGQWGMLRVLDRGNKAILPLEPAVPATERAEEPTPSIATPVVSKADVVR